MARRYKRNSRGQFAGGSGGGGGGGNSVGNRLKAGAKSRAKSAGLRAAAQGVTVSRTIGPVEVRANVSIRPADRTRPTPTVSGGRIPSKRTGRRRARR